MTTFTLDAGFEQPGIQFVDAAGNPMAAGVRVRLYPQNAQIIDQNIVAQDWTRAEGVCPSLNPPAGTYWAYFRGRQGPETPLLITVPEPVAPPQLSFSGSLTATKMSGSTGYFRITGPSGSAYTDGTSTIQVDTANGAIFQIDDSGNAYASNGDFAILSNAVVRISGHSSGSSNGLLTVSNSAQITLADPLNNESGFTFAGLVDGVGTQLHIDDTIENASVGSFIVNTDSTDTIQIIGGSVVSLQNWGGIHQYDSNQSLSINAATLFVCNHAFFNQGDPNDSISLSNGALVTIFGGSSVWTGSHNGAGHSGSITVNGGSLLATNNASIFTAANASGGQTGSLVISGSYIADGTLLSLGNDGGGGSTINGFGTLTIDSGATVTTGPSTGDAAQIIMAGALTFDRDWTQQSSNPVVNIYNGHLWADFTSAQGSGHTVNFTDNSFVQTGDSIATWSWNFGDTNTSTSQNPSHTYASAGTYTVKLTITDGSSNQSDCSVSVVVS